eukprot:6198516-Pleurochrysis_carterae.AAC.4
MQESGEKPKSERVVRTGKVSHSVSKGGEQESRQDASQATGKVRRSLSREEARRKRGGSGTDEKRETCRWLADPFRNVEFEAQALASPLTSDSTRCTTDQHAIVRGQSTAGRPCFETLKLKSKHGYTQNCVSPATAW